MSIYEFEAVRANGEKISLSQYKGKTLLIVNTASKCAYTPQFEDLQKLYLQLKDQNFEMIGFPCNQFGAQEPGDSQGAEEFCKLNYGVTFPIFAKVEVNGKDAHPLFQYLKEEMPFRGFDESNGSEKFLKMMISQKNPEWLTGDEIKWNFTKFLVDPSGTVLRRYEPSEEPRDFEQEIAELIK
ncbi:glutathione peroxidase [Bacillus ectoiniformans]|uniref:glutathione peroxidase n=1 Tax=Bacillus ectoiniformans TaxID=1494429 RepID=UPI0019583762|nr:glutathione peroxidase [Bacillus ectoiniformans]MBM7649262.1 glutathione peroxidase [Bacillus ectoiniformans]